MKKMAAALASIVLLAVAAGLLLSRWSPKDAATANEQRIQASRSKETASPAAGAREIAALAEEKNTTSREKLVEMYVSGAGKPDRSSARRAILRQILLEEEPAMAIQLIVTAVSRDPTPLKSDELFTSAARDMAAAWKDLGTFTKGMDLFRLADSPKAQALLAESLSVRLTSPPAGMENLDGQRYALVSDLMHVYRESNQDPDLKTQLLQNIQTLGGTEMAELAIDPMNPRAAFYKKMEADTREAIRSSPPAQ
jgi:hypothetical protein